MGKSKIAHITDRSASLQGASLYMSPSLLNSLTPLSGTAFLSGVQWTYI
jgi:hypothetical protein